jgi:nicotinamide phosphoribosyltransferase
MNIRKNLILNTDSYKASHWVQYPPGATASSSYLSSRGGRYGTTLFFGLQALLKETLEGAVFTREDIDEAEAFFAAHGEPFNRAGWEGILARHGGAMPIRIRAVPEGTVVPVHNVLMTVESTDPGAFWLPSYLETAILRACWYPTTVATQSFYLKKRIFEFLRDTSDNARDELPFKLHDFGSRGVSSQESAGLGGMAHLVNFQGSDTIEGVRYANAFYGTKGGMAAFSIPAAEHSTITSWGKEGELEAYRNMVKNFGKPGAIFACVSDSYDIWNAVDKLWADELRQEVEESGATLVIRPDSGHPATVVLKLLQILERKLGMETNLRGYKVLPKSFRLIQGDGVDEDSIAEILGTMKLHGYSASNIAFGMGGALLQKVDRDTQKFAFKCSEITIDGQDVPVFKDPVTDSGKRSLSGKLALIVQDGKLATVPGPRKDDVLVPVFENGKILRNYTLDEVRANSERELF